MVYFLYDSANFTSVSLFCISPFFVRIMYVRQGNDLIFSLLGGVGDPLVNKAYSFPFHVRLILGGVTGVGEGTNKAYSFLFRVRLIFVYFFI